MNKSMFWSERALPKGVRREGAKYRSEIWVDKETRYLGKFPTVEAASAAFQEAMVDTMVRRTIEAVKKYDVNGVLLGGGVAANTKLREWMSDQSPVRVVVPRPALCTDNAAMIGAAAYLRFKDRPDRMWDLDVIPGLCLG